MRLVQRLLEQSHIPITVRQFWIYSLGYWSIFAVMTFGQLTALWILREGEPMRYHETFIWLLDGIFWVLTSPFILYASLRLPLVFNQSAKDLLLQIYYHFLILSFFNILINVFHFFITNPIMFLFIGKSIPIEKYLLSICISYTASFGQYMLLVVGFSRISYMYRFQALKQQHFEVELANEQLQSQLATAQLEALKMQLNPHFLFNTLHAVVSLMIRAEVSKATSMIVTLSDLLRSVLANHKLSFIRFSEEITLTKQYLFIQQIRFQDRLQISYDIHPETERCEVPQLILQPLVENSITHGISDLTTNALIHISSCIKDGQLIIQIIDNGSGPWTKKTSEGMGMGLKNTRQRLKQTFGNEAQLTISHPSEGGTVVTIQIKAQTNANPLVHEKMSMYYN
ncbi:sensor histidine kinase [Dyadobacter tibetensis]|uniref:sensor histidine kinase n=1 Tax=Dyadobacter tibetensis TaxID=1211851 RepID=UPI00046F7033|nr:histidine kinase [Dyadobacter tibetensis]